jgi:NNP family nitrate/nitrite transporter-like MFS transporter
MAALGLFGMGNLGTSLTHFLAPMALLAFDWPGVLRIWAVTLGLVAIGFWFLAKDDPATVARRESKAPSVTFASQIAPIARLQVWRFSTYYFFTFGAYVALSLWLPRYYMGMYGVDIAVAGLLGAAFSVPGSAFRAFGGWLSDRIGARRVMYATFMACILITFFLSYPPTDYIVHGIEGDIRFGVKTELVPFVLLTVLLGFFMSLGNAAVYKHIPAYYPDAVGPVGGLVGMIGALGGFVLPIWFGILNDATNLWTSCFMLLFGLVCVALLWMHVTVVIMDRRTIPEIRGPKDLPELQDLDHARKEPGERP